MTITDDDITLGKIAEAIRTLIGDAITPVMDRHIAAGVCPGLVGDAAATGLIALACAFATTNHAAGCEAQRDYLHASVDVLFDQLAAFDAGRVNRAGDTVQ